MINNSYKDESLEIAHPHTLKKFDLIEAYVRSWAQKLLNYKDCEKIIFIDCMCNSGVYKDDRGDCVFGTPIRVAYYLKKEMNKYPSKKAVLYYNDLSDEKINILKSNLPACTDNFKIITNSCDGNELLRNISSSIIKNKHAHYLLVYDPYTASIAWDAITPYLKHWGEVIINHMVSDSLRALPQVKRNTAIEKYEQTYLATLEELTASDINRATLELRIKEIMGKLEDTSHRRYYIASFPFFNRKNSIVYNLIHGSSNIKGFQLFKETAWKTFGGKSSSKDVNENLNQLVMNFVGDEKIKTFQDTSCYNINDIADYLYTIHNEKSEVYLDELWEVLDEHPIFPSTGFKTQIKNVLKNDYNCKIKRSKIVFEKR